MPRDNSLAWEAEAKRFLRDRLDTRDEGRLSTLLTGKTLTFNEWANWFLDKRSKPPYRSEKTHRDNLEVLKNLRPAFGSVPRSEIEPEAIEEYIEKRTGCDQEGGYGQNSELNNEE